MPLPDSFRVFEKTRSTNECNYSIHWCVRVCVLMLSHSLRLHRTFKHKFFFRCYFVSFFLFCRINDLWGNIRKRTRSREMCTGIDEATMCVNCAMKHLLFWFESHLHKMLRLFANRFGFDGIISIFSASKLNGRSHSVPLMILVFHEYEMFGQHEAARGIPVLGVVTGVVHSISA